MSAHRHTEADVDAILRAEIADLLRKSGKPLPALSDGTKLDADLGLSSLDVTTLIVALTARLDAPDDDLTEVEVATVGDLRRAFRPSAAPRPAPQDDALAASRRRAEARRAPRG